MLLQKGEQVFSQFQGTEAHCKHLVLTVLLAMYQLHIPSYKRHLGAKKGKAFIPSKSTIGVVFIH